MYRFSRLHIVLWIILCVVVYNEWLSHSIRQQVWPTLESHSPDSVKILLVADPQLLSVLSETNYPFNLLKIWDSERFIRKGFQNALKKSNPEIIIFLGDLLNDGSKASDGEFIELVKNFKSVMVLPSNVQAVYVPGDNDIGGEGPDKTTANSVNRFYREFNQSTMTKYKFIEMIHVNMMTRNYKELLTIPQPSPDTIRLVFSHIPLLLLTNRAAKEALKHLSPSLLFAGHEHGSFYFGAMKEDAQATEFWPMQESNIVWHFEMMGDKLHEIAVPTCSYRMGIPKYGYGVAVINKTGRMDYTVLWLPSRFTQLWLYLIAVGVSLFILVPFNMKSLLVRSRELYKIHYT